MVKALLRSIWKLCQNETSENIEELQRQFLDLDSPDGSPAVAQQIRVAKVLQLLSEPDATVP